MRRNPLILLHNSGSTRRFKGPLNRGPWAAQPAQVRPAVTVIAPGSGAPGDSYCAAWAHLGESVKTHNSRENEKRAQNNSARAPRNAKHSANNHGTRAESNSAARGQSRTNNIFAERPGRAQVSAQAAPQVIDLDHLDLGQRDSYSSENDVLSQFSHPCFLIFQALAHRPIFIFQK